MKQEIRYKIDPACAYLSLYDKDTKQKTCIHFEHKDFVYFVDILQVLPEEQVKICVYMPNEEILKGCTCIDFIYLYFDHDIFDGRFNSKV